MSSGTKLRMFRLMGVAFLAAVLMIFLAPDIAEARRGGGSFRGSRPKTAPKTQKQPKQSQRQQTKTPTTQPRKAPTSFGGTRMTNQQARAKYGTPRQTQNIAGKNAQGAPQQYVMHSYGGYGSGLMMGYMMGAAPLMWMMPFHPAFYYSRPAYVENPDGTIEVYPPTFSFGKVFITLLIVAGIILIIRAIIRSRKRTVRTRSSFV